MTAATTRPRTVEQIEQEMAAARLARESATGQIKANLTRAIKKLERELAQAQEWGVEGDLAEPSKARKAKKVKGKFNSTKLVEIIEKNGEPMTVEQVADVSGYEATGSLTNRLVWLARRDNLLREVEITVGGRKARAFKRA